MDIVKKTIRIKKKVMNEISAIAGIKAQSENMVIETALKFYIDYCHSKGATFINDEILNTMTATINLLEQRINHKSNQLLSELAIQCAIQNMVLADSLEVDTLTLSNYRNQAVEFLKMNNRILRLSELVE